MGTFHSVFHRGGFTAWGEVGSGSGTIDLQTPGDWLCHEVPGYHRTTAKYSLARYRLFRFTTSAFKFQIGTYRALTFRLGRSRFQSRSPTSWGELRPRSIPHLTNSLKLPQQLLGAYEHDPAEQILSFHLPNWHPLELQIAPRTRVFAHTYIYSPQEQQVEAGMFWGEHYLNGELLSKQAVPDGFGRETGRLNLRRGWNSFFVSYVIFGETWDFHMAVPRAAGLQFSPNQKLGDEVAFVTSGPYQFPGPPDAAWEPFMGAGRPNLAEPWIEQAFTTTPVLPVRHLAWVKFGEPLTLTPEHVEGFELAAGQEASFVLDMGCEVLGRIFVEYDAPAGTVIDVGHTEDRWATVPSC